MRSAGRHGDVHHGLRHAAVLRLPGLGLLHLGHPPLHGPHHRHHQIREAPHTRPVSPGGGSADGCLVCVQALFILGTLLIAMSMQLDRKGLWNLLGPILCALLIMVAAWVSPALSSKRVCDLLVFFLKRPMSSHNSAGVSRGASAALLPAVMETLGLLPHPRRRLRPDWDLPVHLRRDGRQLLLHPLAVAHPGGQLRGVSAAP